MSEACDISADGSTVVGISYGQAANMAFIWTQQTKMQPLGPLDGYTGSEALATSADGSVSVGVSGDDFRRASYWPPNGDPDDLGLLPDTTDSIARGISHSGDVVVGTSGLETASESEAFRQQYPDDMIGLGYLDPATDVASEAHATSADGSVVVGVSGGSAESEAFIWTSSSTEMSGLGHLPGLGNFSEALGVSADGRVVVGVSASETEAKAFRWRDDTMQTLGELAPDTFSQASDVTASGNVIVGVSEDDFVEQAFIWDETNGMRLLSQVLLADYGLDIGDWELSHAIAISDDGQTIAGYGFNPSGSKEAWIVQLPEPTSALLHIAALVTVIGIARRQPLTT